MDIEIYDEINGHYIPWIEKTSPVITANLLPPNFFVLQCPKEEDDCAKGEVVISSVTESNSTDDNDLEMDDDSSISGTTDCSRANSSGYSYPFSINFPALLKKVDVSDANVIDGYSLQPSAFKITFEGQKSLMLSLMRSFAKCDELKTLDDVVHHLNERDKLFPIKCHWDNYEKYGEIETDFFNIFSHKDFFFVDTDENCYGFIAHPCPTLCVTDRLAGIQLGILNRHNGNGKKLVTSFHEKGTLLRSLLETFELVKKLFTYYDNRRYERELMVVNPITFVISAFRKAWQLQGKIEIYVILYIMLYHNLSLIVFSKS